MFRRIIPILFLLSIINAQIALPTFHAVHKPQNTSSSSNNNLEDIFGSATAFTYMANISWTNKNTGLNGWGDMENTTGHFLSYINLTTSTETTIVTTQQATNGNGITAVASTYSGSSYSPAQAINYSTSNNGAWLYTNTNTAVVTCTMSGGWGENRGIQINAWQDYMWGLSHLVKISSNGITRYFAPKDISKTGTNPSSGTYGHVFYPLNDTFTSFTDSRLTSLGTNDAVLPDSYFEYAP